MSDFTRVYFDGLGIDFDLPSVASKRLSSMPSFFSLATSSFTASATASGLELSPSNITAS